MAFNPIPHVDDIEISSYPCFIQDTARGPSLGGDPDNIVTYMSNAQRLEEVIIEFGNNIGVTILRNTLGTVQATGVQGLACVMEAARAEPPMTAEEAHQIGTHFVAVWKALEAAEKVPEYCDTVLPLEENV